MKEFWENWKTIGIMKKKKKPVQNSSGYKRLVEGHKWMDTRIQSMEAERKTILDNKLFLSLYFNLFNWLWIIIMANLFFLIYIYGLHQYKKKVFKINIIKIKAY